MTPEVKRSAYTKANQYPPVDMNEFTREELMALLVTCDGVGPIMKEKALNFLLKNWSDK